MDVKETTSQSAEASVNSHGEEMALDAAIGNPFRFLGTGLGDEWARAPTSFFAQPCVEQDVQPQPPAKRQKSARAD